MLAFHVAAGVVMAAAVLGLCYLSFAHRSKIFQLSVAPIWAARWRIAAAAAIIMPGIIALMWHDDQSRMRQGTAPAGSVAFTANECADYHAKAASAGGGFARIDENGGFVAVSDAQLARAKFCASQPLTATR